MQSQSPAEIDRMIRYHGYFSAQRIELVEQYSATLSPLEYAEQTLVEQRQCQQQQTDALREQQRINSNAKTALPIYNNSIDNSFAKAVVGR